jgi:hypothetical protein
LHEYPRDVSVDPGRELIGQPLDQSILGCFQFVFRNGPAAAGSAQLLHELDKSGCRCALVRVDCRRCGVKVEAVPWAEGKQTLTRTSMQFLAGWARRLSWKEVAEIFHTSWEKVFRSVEWIVEWGLANRNLKKVEAIGVDELLWRKGHHYVTVVYQIANRRALQAVVVVGKDRTIATLYGFFREFGEERTKQLKFIGSDMWKPYLACRHSTFVLAGRPAGRQPRQTFQRHRGTGGVTFPHCD